MGARPHGLCGLCSPHLLPLFSPRALFCPFAHFFLFPRPFLPALPFPPLDSVIPLHVCLLPLVSHPTPDLGVQVVQTVAARLGGWSRGDAGSPLQGCEVQGTSRYGWLQHFLVNWLFQQLSLGKEHCPPKVWSALIRSSAPWVLTHLLTHLPGLKAGACPGA